MIDLKLLRADPELFGAAFSLRQAEVDIDGLVDLDGRHRTLLRQVEGLRAEANRANKAIAGAAGKERADAIAAAKEKSQDLQDIESQLRAIREELDSILLGVPNLVHPDAPPGLGDEANRILREGGEIRQFDFEPKDHLTLGEYLDIIDVDRAGRVSGSRFAFLKRDGALLELALQRFAIERLAPAGFIPVIPPALVKREAMVGTGFFPTDETQVYRIESDDLYLAGTSEVPVASMHAGETINVEDLPLRYLAVSSCFRREAGTHGKDTRGIIRVHQFEKVEMFSFCRAERSEEEHAALLAFEEEIFTALQIPYRVVEICAGDLAAPNYRKYDIEAWLPGSERWLEVTSCSNDIDYQARRLGVRTKSDSGTELVHTLNGTAIACGRAIVALLENHQRSDGSIEIPDELKPFTGFDVIKT